MGQWQRQERALAQSRRRCGSGGLSPGADVGGGGPRPRTRLETRANSGISARCRRPSQSRHSREFGCPGADSLKTRKAVPETARIDVQALHADDGQIVMAKLDWSYSYMVAVRVKSGVLAHTVYRAVNKLDGGVAVQVEAG